MNRNTTYLGSDGFDAGFGIDSDAFGNVVVSGIASKGFPTLDPVLIAGAEVLAGLFVTKPSSRATVNAAGPESLLVQFGNVGELPVVGNWDGQ